MWSRAQLKAKAKYALKINYWKVVLVAFLLTVVVGGATSGFTYENSSDYESTNTDTWGGYEDDDIFGDNFGSGSDFNFSGDLNNEEDLNAFLEGLYGDMYGDSYDKLFGAEFDEGTIALIIMIALIVVVIIFVIALVVSLVWSAFIGNPVSVGASRFFFKSLNEKAEAKELLFSYDSNFKNIAKIMFFKQLYQILWTLLFIIPGIIKSYEYRMIPYLLAENPNLTKEQAFAISKQMMDGQKMDAFVLDLSFIGWEILSALTAGILGIFYVTPYIHLTNAALYEELSLRNGRPAHVEPVVNSYYEPASYQAPEADNYSNVEE